MPILEWVHISTMPESFLAFSTDPFIREPVTGEFVVTPNNGDGGTFRSSDGLVTWRTGTRPGSNTDGYDLNAYHDGSNGHFVTSDYSDNKVYTSLHSANNFSLAFTGTTGDDYYTTANTSIGNYVAGRLATPAAYGVKNRASGGGTVVLNTGSVLPLRLRFNGTTLALFCRNTSTYYTTTDGTAWTTRTFPATVPNEIALNHFIIAGTKFVAVLRDSTSLFISSDGVSWTTKTLPASDYQPRVASDGANKYLVCRTGTTWYYSEDGGDTWTTLTAPAGANAFTTHMPVWDGTAFKVVTFMDASADRVYQLVDATPPETVWSNVAGCNVL
jgi:hypothetical protein